MTPLQRLQLRFRLEDLGSDPAVTLALLVSLAEARVTATSEQQLQHAYGMALELQIAEVLRNPDAISLQDEGSISSDAKHRLTILQRQFRAAYISAGLPVPGEPVQPSSVSVNVISVFDTVPFGGTGWGGW